MLQIVTAIFSMVGKKDDMKDADPKEKVEKIFSLMDTVSLYYFRDNLHSFEKTIQFGPVQFGPSSFFFKRQVHLPSLPK